MKTNCDKNLDQTFNTKDSALAKLAARGNSQRRLLLKNGEVNISRYLINFSHIIILTRKIGNCLKTYNYMSTTDERKEQNGLLHYISLHRGTKKNT